MKSLLVVASFLFSGGSYADLADTVRSITDPNERIIAEMATVVGSRTVQTAVEELSQKVAEDPNEVRHFRVLFNQVQSIDETAYAADSFLHVHSIETKKYDPIRNLVWGGSFSDFEMYKGSAIDRLNYFEQRIAFQRLAIEMTIGDLEGGLPPGTMDVYGIEGFATYADMKSLLDEKASSILDIKELGGWGFAFRISAFVSSFRKMDIPSLPAL